MYNLLILRKQDQAHAGPQPNRPRGGRFRAAAVLHPARPRSRDGPPSLPRTWHLEQVSVGECEACARLADVHCTAFPAVGAPGRPSRQRRWLVPAPEAGGPGGIPVTAKWPADHPGKHGILISPHLAEDIITF